ncbi:hypothetical protein DIURU_005690 [Diutina rugosa]|uniref:2-dehydropantolactone reductase n=1 Tax=Diutina rugosa TaxID=5481 RepID=A0A642UJL1_DIURU|nr:uncharacterized protein DIURU_005690 [Diutina rugosa]KAA8896678.1 hypothetical protein DIURU_005690 [Diutina rugosa]
MSYTLNTGAKIPAIGLGTFLSTPEEVYGAVKEALATGYRHIDTAYFYDNEEAIGRAVKDSGIPRSEIFITTKLWSTQHQNPQKALDDALKALNTDYIDLYLIHWPVAFDTTNGNDKFIPKRADGSWAIDPSVDFVDTYAKLQELDPSKVKAIGVSNFSITNLERLLSAPSTKVTPAANQVEIHPLLPQEELIKYCKAKNIQIEAYCPLGSANSPLLDNPVLAKLGEKYGVPPATIMISWALWREYVVLPKSVNPQRIKSNFEVVKLSDEDGETINNISKTEGIKRIVDPPFGVKVYDDNTAY